MDFVETGIRKIGPVIFEFPKHLFVIKISLCLVNQARERSRVKSAFSLGFIDRLCYKFPTDNHQKKYRKIKDFYT
jgi:hypothetical protein